MTAPRQVGSFYSFTPGTEEDGSPSYFPLTYDGLTGKDGVLARALAATAGNLLTREVSVTRAGRTKVICTVRNGSTTWPGRDGGAVIIPAAPKPARAPRGGKGKA